MQMAGKSAVLNLNFIGYVHIIIYIKQSQKEKVNQWFPQLPAGGGTIMAPTTSLAATTTRKKQSKFTVKKENYHIQR